MSRVRESSRCERRPSSWRLTASRTRRAHGSRHWPAKSSGRRRVAPAERDSDDQEGARVQRMASGSEIQVGAYVIHLTRAEEGLWRVVEMTDRALSLENPKGERRAINVAFSHHL